MGFTYFHMVAVFLFTCPRFITCHPLLPIFHMLVVVYHMLVTLYLSLCQLTPKGHLDLGFLSYSQVPLRIEIVL